MPFSQHVKRPGLGSFGQYKKGNGLGGFSQYRKNPNGLGGFSNHLPANGRTGFSQYLSENGKGGFAQYGPGGFQGVARRAGIPEGRGFSRYLKTNNQTQLDNGLDDIDFDEMKGW